MWPNPTARAPRGGKNPQPTLFTLLPFRARPHAAAVHPHDKLTLQGVIPRGPYGLSGSYEPWGTVLTRIHSLEAMHRPTPQRPERAPRLVRTLRPQAAAEVNHSAS